jgi:zinc-ribbon domain
MVYNQKLVASIKCNGKILREFKDTVLIPFNSEYSIVLKNLNTVKAIVKVTIDGEEILPGGLVIYPNEQIDLERSIKNNNLEKGNKFKFIQMTDSIENHRGTKVDDGLIRVSYQFEKIYQPYFYTNNTPIYGPGIRSYGAGAGGYDNDQYKITASSATSGMLRGISLNNISVATQDCAFAAASVNDAGITVPGSESNQKFSTTVGFPLEDETHVIVLKLLGETEDNKPVTTAIDTKFKPECQTCGRKNKATSKFCSECGTSLSVF